MLNTSEGKDLNGTPTAGHMFGSASSMSKTASDVPMLHEKHIAKEDGPSVSRFHDSKKQVLSSPHHCNCTFMLI